ncbi:transposase [Nocardia sp. NPDC059239]|uniref:transposase n=1 Tax=unclassified Nocardia TaxID=2637762 RepID=UPI003691E9A7
MAPPKKYPDALRAHAIRLYRESDPKPTFRTMAAHLGVHHEALRLWIRHAEQEQCATDDSPSATLAAENKRLRKQVADLERVIAILRAGRAHQHGIRPNPAVMNNNSPLPSPGDGGRSQENHNSML